MKKFITVLLSFVLYFNTFSQAHAAGMGGWTLSNPLAQGASTLYNGAKNVIINGKNVAKTSTALITPTASQVAKLLGKGVAGVALSFAVEQLLGKVDWVLDPANNRIRYYVDPEAVDPNYVYTSSKTSIIYQTIKDLCEADYKIYFSDADLTGCRVHPNNPGLVQVLVGKNNVTYNDYVVGYVTKRTEPVEQEEGSIPLETVAQKVISNAEAGNKDAQVATTAAAADVVNDAQKDDAKARPIVNQLEANSKTETDADAGNATGETKPNTTTGGSDLSLTFPVFCSWAPTICEAAQTVISFPTTLTDWWNESKQKTDSWAKSISDAYASTKEWFQKDRDKGDDQLDIPVPDTPHIDSDIGFSGSCPADKTASVNLGLGTIKMDFTYSHICTVASDIRGIVIFCGFFIGALIIGGVKQ